MDQAETLLMRAAESGQFSAAVSALREKAVLSGHRVERKEVGAPGDFDALSDDELERALIERIPDEHILVRVDRVLDLSWLRSEVDSLYCIDNGRPGIDPEVAVRLMLAGFLLGFVHDRRLMREAQVNIAIRWFVGYALHEALPDHSSLSRIRQCWGADLFRHVFERTVRACVEAKIATGEVVHVDASLIRTNVSWESLVERHLVGAPATPVFLGSPIRLAREDIND
jgi:transposase